MEKRKNQEGLLDGSYVMKTLSGPPVGTRAQEAIKLQRSMGKGIHREKSREMREAEEERRFHLRQEKKKQKHRGH